MRIAFEYTKERILIHIMYFELLKLDTVNNNFEKYIDFKNWVF